MRQAAVLLGALALVPFAGAQAASDAAGRFETEYLIVDEITTGGREERPIADREAVFQQRLSFAQLATADAALTLEDGRVVVPAGEQYFRAASGDVEVWCTANMRMPTNAFAATVVGRVYPQYCIHDPDRDGVFDRFFKKQRTIEVLPNVRGKLPQGLRPIAPIRLTPIGPAQLRTSYYLGVELIRATKGEPRIPIFQMFAGSEFGRFPIRGTIAGLPGTGQRVRIADAVIEVSTTSEGVSARLVTPFAVGPTRIRGTNCGMINGC